MMTTEAKDMIVENLDAVVTDAQTNPISLVTLVHVFHVKPSELTICKKVEDRNVWTAIVNKTYWDNHFDGDLDNLYGTIKQCLNSFNIHH